MTSLTVRAASFAAQLTAATTGKSSIEHDALAGTATVRTTVPGEISDRAWKAIRLALIGLPPQDAFGSLRAADGAVQLWAILRDPSGGAL